MGVRTPEENPIPRVPTGVEEGRLWVHLSRLHHGQEGDSVHGKVYSFRPYGTRGDVSRDRLVVPT